MNNFFNNSNKNGNSNYKYKIPKFENSSIKKNANFNSNSNSNSNGFRFYFMIFLIVLIFILIIFLGYYIFTPCFEKKPLTDFLMDGTLDPCSIKEQPTKPTKPPLPTKKEVFHISNQDYTYNQAKCKCAAYGAKLATKNQITDAYNKGAEWCSYGWSEGQNAYYPTQKCTWDNMQEGDPKHRFDCGLPGVNGGFFSNPKLKFGVNCYGVKPKGQVVKEKQGDCDNYCEATSNYHAAHKLDTDDIAPFNKTKWSL